MNQRPLLGQVPRLELANRDSSIEWQSSKIEIGDSFGCIGGAIYHPSSFFLNQMQSWNMLEVCQRQLNLFYEGVINNGKDHPPDKTEEYYKPENQHLCNGMFVAVFHRKEWHRGLILMHDETAQKYKILMIDYGDHKYYSLSLIRFIPVMFLQKLPAQGIKCSLHFTSDGIKDFLGKDGYWTTAEADIFLESFVQSKEFEVHFVRCETNLQLADPFTWHVQMNKIFRDTKNISVSVVSPPKPWDEKLFQILEAKWKQKQDLKDNNIGSINVNDATKSTAKNYAEKYNLNNFYATGSSSDLNVAVEMFTGTVINDLY